MFRKNTQGFSLIEAMVTLAIAIIVVSIGIPSFQATVLNNRKSSAINDLSATLNLARSTAITTQQRVTVCKSDNGTSCKINGATSNWAQGWMVFTNPQDLDAPAVLATDLIRIHGALSGNNVSLIGSGPTVNKVSFKPQGMADGNIGTITYCDARGASEAGALIISFGGQIRLAKDSNGNGTVEDGSNNEVTC